MPQKDDDQFRVRPRPPRTLRGETGRSFTTRVLFASCQLGKATRRRPPQLGAKATLKRGAGHVAATFLRDAQTARSRRVMVKVHLTHLGGRRSRALAKHLQYISRDGVTREGEPTRAYSSESNEADLREFNERTREDRHQFRLILAPEDALELGDLRAYTRQVMSGMEVDLGTRLEWVAVDHWDTDNPHTHVVLRGKGNGGENLIIARDYISHGMRYRAAKVADQWLGPRTDLEIRQSLNLEVEQHRWTGLDQALKAQAVDGVVDLLENPKELRLREGRLRLLGRLQRLGAMGLAHELEPGRWQLAAKLEPTLRQMGERGDIIRTMQRALGPARREFALFDPERSRPIIGRVAGKGIADELTDRAYVVIDGVDGRAHYVPLPHDVDLDQLPKGGIIEVRRTQARAADGNIAAVSEGGTYDTTRHVRQLEATGMAHEAAQQQIVMHIRRLEALRRAGIVERYSNELWRVPADLVEQGRAYDQRRGGHTQFNILSYHPIDQQTRVIGATWLDGELAAGKTSQANAGFGIEVREAMKQRASFLVDHGFAERQGQRLVLVRDFMGTLRERDIGATAKAIADQTGLTFRNAKEGEQVSGTYKRSLFLASGRFALLEHGLGFSLVPWRPVIEQRLGRSVSAVLRAGSVSWEIGRQIGLGR